MAEPTMRQLFNSRVVSAKEVNRPFQWMSTAHGPLSHSGEWVSSPFQFQSPSIIYFSLVAVSEAEIKFAASGVKVRLENGREYLIHKTDPTGKSFASSGGRGGTFVTDVRWMSARWHETVSS